MFVSLLVISLIANHKIAHGDPCEESIYQRPCEPNEWPKVYPKCGGSSQSPIDIDPHNTAYSPQLQDLQFDNYDKSVGRIVVHNGNTFYFQALNFVTGISNGSHSEPEQLLRWVMFHWGNTSDRGSEHTINGKRFPLEVQLIHLGYKRTSDSLKTTIISVLFELTEDGEGCEGLDPIIEKLDLLKVYKEKWVHSEWIPKSVLPTNTKEYYTYTGSQTDPPCDDATSIVLKNTLKVSEKQLQKFRELKDHWDKPLGNTFRPPQPLNGRTVHASFNG